MSPVSAADVLIAACGPAAIRVSGCSGDREQDWRVVHHLARSLARRGGLGLTGSIPTYESVLIEFDPMLVSATAVAERIRESLDAITPDEALSSAPQTFTIPVLYGGEMGPDLDDVARLIGLEAEDVIRVHQESNYTVRCLGAPGGSPMLDGPFPVPVPRLSSPRASVPAGVVSVAGRQATVAPASAPGGWSVIGRTPLTLLDLTREPLVPYAPGDRIRFTRINEETFDALSGERLQADGATK
ncbi:5-oxoprolinase subunit B family protein [Cryobacterium tepidiphilum]|uniref:Carboxyltransferase domain-containing protein n=1 Tax=Cryobacterium tepidiphilum TaxID=2486026 RepID=A0A3M8LRE2_9MICO|nr:carboxyltransferase domain-containing protein [Cryobacterium tepidiphilum]RNE67314.1 carboxyltransferase domain-containing protein [Cryobacterium tepidiphilum]